MQEQEFEKICESLKNQNLDEKIRLFSCKSNFTGGYNNLRLEHVINALLTHVAGRDPYDNPNLLIKEDSVFLAIDFKNDKLVRKYKADYRGKSEWLFEACLDIYLGLYEIRLMNNLNESYYKILRENIKLKQQLNINN